MKIGVTFEISDEDRLLYGVRATGQLVPAKRNTIIEFIKQDVEGGLIERRAIFEKHTQEVLLLLGAPPTTKAKSITTK